jgi:hypothetical protein
MNFVGQRPPWQYGQWASFGIWAHPSAEKILLLFYAGVVLERKHKFEVKIDVTHKISGEVSEEPTAEITVKEKIIPSLKEVKPSGGTFSKADFPMYVFVSENQLICSDSSMKTWRKFKEIGRTEFYKMTEAISVENFELPDLDTEIYSDDGKEETQRGLLTPIWRLNVDKDSLGNLYLNEILDIHTNDAMQFGEPEASDETGGDEDGEDPCKDADAVDGGGVENDDPFGDVDVDGDGGGLDEPDKDEDEERQDGDVGVPC